MKFSSTVLKLGSILFHVIALSIVLFFFWPVAEWYLTHRPILGVDFFNMATYARFFSNNFEFFPRGYMSNWYGGSPVLDNVIFTWYWVVGLIARFVPLIEAVKYSVVGGFFFLIFFTYIAAQRLSRNHFFSALLAILVTFSANIYGSATWGGSLPYFLNQIL